MAKTGVLDKEIAHILRRHREMNLGISQAEIARRAKYDNVQMISYLETARNPIPRDMRNRERLANAYQLDITEFCRWCLVAEMERDGMPPTLLFDIAHQPLLGPENEGYDPRDSGPFGQPGGPDPQRRTGGRPAITFADKETAVGPADRFRMPNIGLIRDILLTMARHMDVPPTGPEIVDDQATRGRSALACQAHRSVLIMSILLIKQMVTDTLSARLMRTSECIALR